MKVDMEVEVVAEVASMAVDKEELVVGMVVEVVNMVLGTVMGMEVGMEEGK